MAEAQISMDEIKRMTLPQLACRAADKPPASEANKFTSLEAYKAAIRENEESWSRDP